MHKWKQETTRLSPERNQEGVPRNSNDQSRKAARGGCSWKKDWSKPAAAAEIREKRAHAAAVRSRIKKACQENRMFNQEGLPTAAVLGRRIGVSSQRLRRSGRGGGPRRRKRRGTPSDEGVEGTRGETAGSGALKKASLPPPDLERRGSPPPPRGIRIRQRRRRRRRPPEDRAGSFLLFFFFWFEV